MTGRSVTIKILMDCEAQSGRKFFAGQLLAATYYAHTSVFLADTWLHNGPDPIFKVMTPLELLAEAAE